ncbi:hypothetical protein [Polaromonas sp. C04]|uniref:hypothetical protein n=1 Tax=Polaromonas sp. C04 TaxID=1945857 RepID=UPI0009841232|nr:hypothetical protein [Polaromonas sp. C04]OOG58586.1 hypothetical protein B0E49_01340 [Polaromonas sp. C04]
MGPLDLLIQLLNFVAPALFVAIVTALASRLFERKGPAVHTWWAQVAINSVVGVAALLLGLWYFGHDGKMATYAALVLGCATSQWLMVRGWRR